MKASIKFREESKPIFKAKVPISVLGLPFQSGVVAGEHKELSLSIATFFQSGPSIKLSYRPNDSRNPFSVVLKTGTGDFGSPISSPMLMSAEFNLLGKGNPSFMLHLKPRFGDFSLKKSQSSADLEADFVKLSKLRGGGPGSGSDDDSSIEIINHPRSGLGIEPGKETYGRKISVVPPLAASAIAGMLSGAEVAARTILPLKSHACMTLRWGIKFPAVSTVSNSGKNYGFDLRKVPFLEMNKIGLEFHANGMKPQHSVASPVLDVSNAVAALNGQLNDLKSDNEMLIRAIEEVKTELHLIKKPYQSATTTSSMATTRNGSGAKLDKVNNEKKDGEAAEELKRSQKGGVGGK